MKPRRESDAALLNQPADIVETGIPARLDRLPWGRFHTLVVTALGITWILDGLEVTLASSVAGALKDPTTLGLSNVEIGVASSAYLLGAVLGALGFGWLTDRWGRKRLFSLTLLLYLIATAATAFSWNAGSYVVFRFLTGAGIGGEYTAINSTIQELIPARWRGWTDLVINGSFWIGAAGGAVGAVILLDPEVLGLDLGWRAAYFIGALLGLVILFLRRLLPESPRWLMTHGRAAEAESIVAQIEAGFADRRSPLVPVERTAWVRIRSRRFTPMRQVFRTLFRDHRQRAVLGLTLMAAQAFFYNAIFFTYALVLTDFYGISAGAVGWYILPFALGNFLGPLLLGRLFDTVGRRPMIAATYALSGVLLILSGILFQQELISATEQTIAWSVIFFFASAAASSAYLTVSESFPLEIRALAIAVFYAFGTGIGGMAGPALFGALIDTGSRTAILGGYPFGATLMLVASIVAWRFGIAAERRPLEAVARPLSFADD